MTALREVAAGLPCVDGPLGSDVAAAIHRLEGVRLFTHGSLRGALRSFQVSRRADFAYTPPEPFLRPGSTVHELWERAGRAPASPWIELELPDGFSARVDGMSVERRPADLPAIVQLVAARQVVWTRFIPAGQDLPGLDMLEDQASVALASLTPGLRLYREAERQRREVARARVVQTLSASVLAVSSVLFAINARAVAEHRDPATHPDRLPLAARRANLSATAGGLTFVGGVVGLGVGFSMQRGARRGGR